MNVTCLMSDVGTLVLLYRGIFGVVVVGLYRFVTRGCDDISRDVFSAVS